MTETWPDLPGDAELDARGLSCPLPLLKAKLELNRLPSGALLKVLATDAGSQRDFRAFTRLGRPSAGAGGRGSRRCLCLLAAQGLSSQPVLRRHARPLSRARHSCCKRSVAVDQECAAVNAEVFLAVELLEFDHIKKLAKTFLPCR